MYFQNDLDEFSRGLLRFPLKSLEVELGGGPSKRPIPYPIARIEGLAPGPAHVKKAPSHAYSHGEANRTVQLHGDKYKLFSFQLRTCCISLALTSTVEHALLAISTETLRESLRFTSAQTRTEIR